MLGRPARQNPPHHFVLCAPTYEITTCQKEIRELRCGGSLFVCAKQEIFKCVNKVLAAYRWLELQQRTDALSKLQGRN